MSWTEDRVEVLKDLWGQGKTAAQIAAILGGVTRNAVIGKAHRLSLAARTSPIQRKKAANSSPPRAPANKKVAAPTQPATIEAKPGCKKVSMVDLGPRDCCFPLGDPKRADFGFCGDKAAPGLPYCEAHAAIAYQPARRGRAVTAPAKNAAPAKAASA